MTCDKLPLVEAYFDHELGAASAIEVEEHLAGCDICSGALEEDRRLRAELRETVTYYRMPEGLLDGVASAEKKEAPPGLTEWFVKWLLPSPPALKGAICGAALMLVAAISTYAVFAPPAADLVIEDVSTAHLRSLLAGHLIDVASTDRHTVKPWFNGRVDVSPPVADFAAKGFSLVGGRLDYVDERIVAVTVYRHGNHVINVFSWPDRGRNLPNRVTRGGYNLQIWRQDNLVFCAVSDVSAADLSRLAALIRTESRSQHRE